MTEISRPSDELRLVRQHKETLQHVIKIARAVARLHKGLQAVLLLGRPTFKIPKHAIRFFDELSADVKQLPAKTLQQDLAAVDRLVRADFDKILAVALDNEVHFPSNMTPSDQGRSHENEVIHRLLDDFRRRAQTAVCLRVILRERGISTAPLTLPVAEEIIQQQIVTLEQKESRYKTKIRNEVSALQRDVDALLSKPTLPDPVKRELQETRAGLQLDMEHIDAGKDLDNLPFPIESVESATPSSIEIGRPSDIQNAAIPNVPDPAAEAAVEKKRGFFATLQLWLNTPWQVSWKKISSRRTDKSKPD